MKSLVESKIFWVQVAAILVDLAGVIPEPYGHYVAAAASFLTVILRANSNTEITSVMPK